MSTVTAPRRPGRPGAAPSRSPASRPPVRVVRAPATTPARAPFVVLVLVLLSLGLGALLLLNTLLAQGSFTLHELDAKVAGLTDQEQALQQKAAQLASPKRLARSARELGMVASVNPAFLRTEDGKVLGAPVPAPTPPPVVGSVAEPNTSTATDSSTGSGAGEIVRQQTTQDIQAQPNQQGGTNNKGNGGADR
ncbi:MAG: cell division protein FtsL [Actinomycetia bacterium]|nr:cell division protein FtsL [Actinomycetes bacterium]